MAIQAPKRVEPSWYVLEEDQDNDENPARFKIRALTSSEQLDIYSSFADGKATTRTFRDCFKVGVMEIENVSNAKGKPVRGAPQFLMLQDMFDYVIEVGAEVFNKSFLDEEEKKTLSSE